MFNQMFPSPQVKRCAIITWYIRVASRVAERLKANDLSTPRYFRRWGAQCPHKKKKTSDPWKLATTRKVSKPHRMNTQCPAPLQK